MRVLIISQYFWPESFRINDVATSLREEGCEVTILTGQPNYPGGKTFAGYRGLGMGADRSDPRYDIVRVPLAPRGKSRAAGLILNYLSFVLSAALFGPWLLRGRRYDVIFVYAVSPILQAIPAIWLKWIKRAPLVIWVQDLWPDSLEVTGFVKNRTLLRLVGALTRWIYRRSDLLLGQSKAFVRAIRPMAPNVPVEYHPTPGDRPNITAPSAPAALKLPAGLNVVFAGNLGTAQAMPTILAAAVALRDHPDIRFILVGDGSQKEWLAGEIERHGLDNVLLPGRYPPEAIGPILAQASALLVTLNRSDAMAKIIPAKISTYLAAGRPIIAAVDGEGGEVIVDSGAGIACPAEDASALAAAILRLRAAGSAESEAMGRAGRAYFDAHFEPSALARRLVGLFNGAIERKTQHNATPTS